MLGRADYDPNEIAKDGPFRAPRKWLHVQKVMTACTVYAIALSLAHALGIRGAGEYAAIVAVLGPLAFSGLREAIDPTDPDTHTVGERLLDKFTDGALYAVPMVLELFAMRRPIAAVIALAVLAIVYRVCRNGARP